MRIVFFATRFAFEYSIELANNISFLPDVEKVYLFLPANSLSKIQKDQISDNVLFNSFFLYGNSNFFSSLKSFSKVVIRIKEIKPDLIHVQGSAHPFFWLFYYKINKIPLVDTIHDATPHPGFGNILQTFRQGLPGPIFL